MGSDSGRQHRRRSGNRSGYGESESHTLQPKPVLPEEAYLSLECGEDVPFAEGFVFIAGKLFKWNLQRYLRVRWMREISGRGLEAMREEVPTDRPRSDCVTTGEVIKAFFFKSRPEFRETCRR